jgi:16S rRNA processing protein RimM
MGAGPGAPEQVEVGRIGRAHGLQGEVAVTFLSDRPERRAPGAHLVARSPGADDRDVVVASSRPHQERWLVRFEGVDDRTTAETFRGCTLHGEGLPPEGDDELWVHDLVGCRVMDVDGAPLGTIVAVEANPAHDLLVLDGGGLVPVPFIVEHDGHAVTVRVPEGLLDL